MEFNEINTGRSAMGNLTQDLLAEYYGVGRDGKTLSIRRIDNAPLADASQPDPPNQQNGATRTGNEETVDGGEKDSIEENTLSSPRTVNDEDDEDLITPLYFDEFLKLQDESDDEESSGKKEELPDSSGFPLGNEEVEGTDSGIGVAEEVFPESSSDVSLLRRKPRRSLKKRVLPPLPKKTVWTETYVDLTSSGLEQFPAEILDKYSGLRMLYLANNGLVCLPDQLFPSLKCLEWLDLRDNRLTTLPSNIKAHPSLETLLLQGNQIAELPLELCLIPKIKRIQVARNPLVFPPQEVVMSGFAAMIDFLRSEWNKAHPEEQVEPVQDECKPCPSTILCYPLPSSKKNSKVSISRSATDLGEIRKRIALGKRYRPNNRYGIQENKTCLANDRPKEREGNLSLLSSSGKSLENLEEIERSLEDVGEEKLGKVDKIDEINEKIQKLMSPSSTNSFCARRKSCLGKFEGLDEKSCKVKLPSIDLKRLHSARKKPNDRLANQNSSRISKDSEEGEKIFEIVTNDRRILKLRPTQLKDPDVMLSLLESCVAVNK